MKPPFRRTVWPIGLLPLAAAVVGLGVGSPVTCRAAAPTAPPNVILILCDNLGYGDLGCYGSQLHRTPHVDRLAAEGLRFTDCYAASGVCTPSRAALLTGCYPRRVNLHVSDKGGAVLQPVAAKGLHPDELTLAEVLKARGYVTGCLGKWHLGDQPQFLPTRQGFDYYLGIPYSDDMTARPGEIWPELPLMRGEQVIEAPVDRNFLTERYTREALAWIEAHRNGPFFLFLSHAMPGSTKRPFARPEFQGRSANGQWGDAVEELDWSTGELLAALARWDLDERTLVIFTNDNGAMRRDPPQGSNRPLAGWGYTTDEGGMRVPCLVRWPGRVAAGRVCGELVTLMDWFPTLARLAGAELAADRPIDGHDIGPLLFNAPGARSPYEAFYYYDMDQLQAVRAGRWKLYLELAEKRGRGNRPPSRQEARLVDLVADPSESSGRNWLADEPEVVRRLLALAERARAELGDEDREGAGQRPAGWEPRPTPRALPMP